MLPNGTTIGGYRIERPLGEGGMATVYEARQLSLNRMVALKVLAQRLGSDSDFRDRFKRECEIQAKLDHPNIVHVYGAEDSEYGLWLAMQLVEGPTLRELLGGERLDLARALRLLGPIASAVDTAHRHRLIHRDITPRNILVGANDHPYLTDFGITKTFGDCGLTATGRWLGTVGYLSPEQIEDKEETEATDVYALATILFECLTGRLPFDKRSDVALVYAHVHEQPPRATAVAPGLPKKIDAVLAKGLAKDPDERYRRASELIDAAVAAFPGRDWRRRGQPAARQPPKPPPRSRPAIDRDAVTRTG